MVAKCYLCEKGCNKNKNIVLHRFPKSCLHTYQQWLNACGLNERDNVSNVYICTRHFESSVFRIKNTRLRLHRGAVPTIDVLNPVLKPVVKEEKIENDATATNIFPKTLADSITIDYKREEQLTSQNSNIDTENNEYDKEQIILQTPDSEEPDPLQLDIPDIDYKIEEQLTPQDSNIEKIENDDATAANIFPKTLADSITIDYKREEQLTSQNSNIDTGNNEYDKEQIILQTPDTEEPDPLQFDIPVKQRRFAQARYISEIDLYDVATPRRAKRTLTFVKLTDKKKSKQIKLLRDTKRRLTKRVIFLQQIVSHIRKKGLILNTKDDIKD